MVTGKELEEIKTYSGLSHQTQSEFIRTAIWDKIKLINTSSKTENSLKRELLQEILRLEELKKIRKLLEKHNE